MSKWIDKSVQKIVKEKIETLVRGRNILEEDEINEIMPQVVKHFKESEDDEIFEDGGMAFVLVTMPTIKGNLKEYTSQYNDEVRYNIFCESRLGTISTFGTKAMYKTIKLEGLQVEDDEGNQGWAAWVRGKMTVTFDLMGSYGQGKMFNKKQYFKTLEEAIAACNKKLDEKGDKRRLTYEHLDENDLEKHYTLNIVQVIV